MAHSSPVQPDQSLIWSICQGNLFMALSMKVRQLMLTLKQGRTNINFKVKTCGGIINQDCFGEGCGEVKCPIDI